jgi:hypothetical protein
MTFPFQRTIAHNGSARVEGLQIMLDTMSVHELAGTCLKNKTDPRAMSTWDGLFLCVLCPVQLSVELGESWLETCNQFPAICILLETRSCLVEMMRLRFL